ncbi:MAG: hypothetical protein IT372_34875 [Polyangiaceae bacterium]|nr:hypothetical protein [Polyangiaceae bacterium]
MRKSLLGGVVRGVAVGTAVRLFGELFVKETGARIQGGGRPSARGLLAREPALTPAGAVARGLVAGATGSLAQAAFFRVAQRWAPAPPEGAFTPPEPAQREEQATETVARRVVEGLMLRGPIADKRRAGELVHYAFGAAWGGVYGLVRATTPAIASPAGVLAFSTVVWAVSDDLILPAFRLAGWPAAYPLKSHAFAWGAHVAYGAAVALAFEAQRRSTWASAGALLSARWATRGLPGFVRPGAAKLLAAVRARAVGDRLRGAAREAAMGALARAA